MPRMRPRNELITELIALIAWLTNELIALIAWLRNAMIALIAWLTNLLIVLIAWFSQLTKPLMTDESDGKCNGWAGAADEGPNPGTDTSEAFAASAAV